MRSRIPLPDIHESLSDMANFIQKMREARMQQPLIQAQTEQAKASAFKSQMLAKLMSQAFGGSPSPSGVSSDMGNNQASSSSTGSGYQPQASGSAGNKAMDMLYALGYLKETPAQQASREQQTAYASSMGKVDADVLGDWNKKITAASEMEPVFENIRDIISNPKIQQVYKNPEYMNYDVKYAKRFNDDPEVQQGLTSLGTNIKSIFSSMGSEFKGAFRGFELNLFNAAAPTDEDSLNQLIAKNNTLMQLKRLASKRFSRADDIVRSSGGKISPASALQIASREINTKDIRDQVKREYENLESLKKQKVKVDGQDNEKSDYVSSSDNSSKKENSSNKPVVIIYRKGKQYSLPPEMMNQALREGGTLEP